MNFYGFVTSSRHCGQTLRSCSTCGKETFHTLEKRKEWFTLFFLPVVLIGLGRSLSRCNLCGHENGEGSHGPSTMSHVQAGTKTCPECAELIKLEARLCRYCRYRFSEEDITAARQHVEGVAAEMAEQIKHRNLTRKARLYSLLSWLIIPPAVLVSIFIGVHVIMVFAGRAKNHDSVAGAIVAWVILSLPLVLGLHFRRKARQIRRGMEDPPAETEEDIWGRSAASDQ